jgi:hypothetical protein
VESDAGEPDFRQLAVLESAALEAGITPIGVAEVKPFEVTFLEVMSCPREGGKRNG